MTASFEAPFERALHSTEEAELCQMVAQLFLVGGGGKRDRTDDLLLAKQALSQLSYAPT